MALNPNFYLQNNHQQSNQFKLDSINRKCNCDSGINTNMNNSNISSWSCNEYLNPNRKNQTSYNQVLNSNLDKENLDFNNEDDINKFRLPNIAPSFLINQQHTHVDDNNTCMLIDNDFNSSAADNTMINYDTFTDDCTMNATLLNNNFNNQLKNVLLIKNKCTQKDNISIFSSSQITNDQTTNDQTTNERHYQSTNTNQINFEPIAHSTIRNQCCSSDPISNGRPIASVAQDEIENHLETLAKFLNDLDQVVVEKTMQMTYQIFQIERYRNFAMKNAILMKTLIYLALNNANLNITKYVLLILYELSKSRIGQIIIFQIDCIPVIYKFLQTGIKSLIFYAIATLYSLISNIKDVQASVRDSGIPTLVDLLGNQNLDSRDKFLAFLTACLRMIAIYNQEGKDKILDCNGPKELIKIIDSFSYDKLLLNACRLLKVLSCCPKSKQAIIENGGVQTLVKHLKQNANSRLTLNCLWTIRNLSDAIGTQLNKDVRSKELLHYLVNLLQSKRTNEIVCAVGILSNLTCDNPLNKQFLYQIGGLKELVRTLFNASDNESIIEPTLITIRHLTYKNPSEEDCQQLVRLLGAIEPIVKFLFKPQYKWSTIKAAINLIRNIGLNNENFSEVKESGAFQRFCKLLAQANCELRRVCPSKEAFENCIFDEVKLQEVIENILSTFLMYEKDQVVCQFLIGLDFIPLCFQMIHYQTDNCIKLATQALCKLASYELGLLFLIFLNIYFYK